MEKYFKISIIGSGNVAWHLSQALESFGHSIIEIYDRNLQHAQRLCSKLYNAIPCNTLDFSNSKSAIFIIAVSDKAISEVVEKIHLPEAAILIHTSGTASLEILEQNSHRCGILYPIQTFSKNRKVNFKEVPFSIEASDKTTRNVIRTLAESLSKNIHFHTTEERRIIHLASVFASNFTNHMLTVSKGLLESNRLNFDLVKPLIMEVIGKSFELGPENSQTGPAIRNDRTTIEKHLTYLSEEKGLTEIYNAITNDIIKTYED